jgi:hypothetical protein
VVTLRSPVPVASILLDFAAAVLCAGCMTSYGFAAGPTVDTRGEVGMQFSARMSIGVPLSEENALAEVVRVDAAPPGLSLPHVSPVVGFDYVHELEDDELAVRAGIRARFQLAWEDPFRSWIGVGLSLGILPTLGISGNDSGEFTHVGVEFEGYWLEDDAAEVPEGQHPPQIGQFGVSLVYEEITIDNDPFDDWWD